MKGKTSQSSCLQGEASFSTRIQQGCASGISSQCLADHAGINTRSLPKSFVFFPFPTGRSPGTQVLMKSNKTKMGKLLQSYEHLRGATPH